MEHTIVPPAAAANHPLTPRPLDGRVAIITGGSGGIGTAITNHLAALGASVVVAYLGDPSPANRLVSDLKPHCRALAVPTDISIPAQVKSLFDAAELEFGEIHILVTAAGVQDSSYPHISDTSVEAWDRTFAVNARGTFLCCREAAARVARGGKGRIITVSSSNVETARAGYGAYAASKGAVEAMTRVLAKELKGTGITANAVAPGPVMTPMFLEGKSEERVAAVAEEGPMGRIGTPEDVAPLVGFLASDAGEWVNGQVIRVNGGYI